MTNRMTTDEKLDYIKLAMAQLEQHIAELEAEIKVLETQEMFFAREWWKDKKYLYLVFPQDRDGNRKRVYVGCNKGKIADAMAKIERWEYHRDLCAKLRVARTTLHGDEATLGLLAARLRTLIGDTTR